MLEVILRSFLLGKTCGTVLSHDSDTGIHHLLATMCASAARHHQPVREATLLQSIR